MKTPKRRKLGKKMVMQPQFQLRVHKDKKDSYSRKVKHKGKPNE